MKKSIQLALIIFIVQFFSIRIMAYSIVTDGVYTDEVGTLFICKGVSSIEGLNVNPTTIYSFATPPPTCNSSSFSNYTATLHVTSSAMTDYFFAPYWSNFVNLFSDAIEPESVVLNKNEISLEKYKSETLSAVVYPNNATPQNVEWVSTDTNVAKVTNGNVVALSPGECEIVASCVDKEAHCHVVVTQPKVTITLDEHNATLWPNEVITINVSCTPEVIDLTSTSSNQKVASSRIVNNTLQVLGIKPGTAKIIVNSVDGSAVPDSCIVEVYGVIGDVNGDREVNIADINAVISLIQSGSYDISGDVNVDKEVNIADINAIIDLILNPTVEQPTDQTITVNGVQFKMIAVEGGTYTMGATAEQGNDGASNEKPTHQVTLSNFAIGETEITQELWEAVMGDNPSDYTDSRFNPVNRVSWYDCQTFIDNLTYLTGKYFRLPTEAEWEFAARGGNKCNGYKYAGSDFIDDVAWYYHADWGYTYLNGIHAVASKNPNELGLYDMSGNVSEWCLDWFGSYNDEAQINPTGPITGTERVLRGGSWGNGKEGCRVTSRYKSNPDRKSDYHGLRIAMDIGETVLSSKVPVITTKMLDNVVIISASGEGNVSLFVDDEVVDNPYEAVRTNTDYEIIVYATAKEDWKRLSQCEPITISIPAKPYSSLEPFTVNVNGVFFTMVPVDGGTFIMGATEEQGNNAQDNEKPTHSISLNSYYICHVPVTQALWVAVMGSNPSYYQGDIQRPVENISWQQCQTFITKLNEKTGKCFRLPTEAEWEFAARGGNRSRGYKYSGSNKLSDVAWFNGYNSGLRSTQPVGMKNPNELGLYDMSGNVFEWCHDRYGDYSVDPQINPAGPEEGSSYVVRGGCWGSDSTECRVSFRKNGTSSSIYYGLRLAYGDENLTGSTALPIITTETTNDAVIISAIGDGNVVLYINNMAVSNPYYAERGWDDYNIFVYATAKAEGKDMSKSATTTLTIPAHEVTEEPTITVKTASNALTITAIGNGTVKLYVDGSPVTNPYLSFRQNNDYFITCYATAQEDNKFINRCNDTTIVIPAIVQLQDETIEVNGITFKMIAIEGGTFTMGATDEQGNDSSDEESPSHEVTLSKFSIGETEVTQELWFAVMGDNPSKFKPENGYEDGLLRPVEGVSWISCQTFIAALNELTGRSFRLPTEAEWEFAARGGNASLGFKYAGSNSIDEVGWCKTNARDVGSDSPDYGTHPVGSKSSNELGLYDMSGNVWEWCQDWYDVYSGNVQMDPSGPETGEKHCIRGGSWYNEAARCRVSSRGSKKPTTHTSLYGLRLAL